MKPHRVEYWLNAKPADPEVFADQVAAVKPGRRWTGAAEILPRPPKAGGKAAATAEAPQAGHKAVGISLTLAALPLLGATTTCTVKGNS